MRPQRIGRGRFAHVGRKHFVSHLRRLWDKEAAPPLESRERCPGGFPAPEGSTSGLRTRHAEPALRRRRLRAAAYRA